MLNRSDPRALLDALVRSRGEDYAALSRLLGRNPSYIQQYIKRGSPRRLSEADRSVLARYFGVAETALGASAAEARQTLRPLPLLVLRASAGTGEAGATALGLGFGEQWLRNLAGGSAEGLALVPVEGDSMEPTIGDGDDVIVNRLDAADRLRDGIYVLRRDDALLVKRLGRSPLKGRVTVRSDNPAYPDWTDVKLSTLDIVGRVLWAGRRLG